MQREFVILAAVCLSVVVFAGCAATPTVVMRPNERLASGATITVVSKAADPLAVQAKLEHLLFSKGFKVVSEAVAREQLRVSVDTSVTDNKAYTSGVAERVREVRSVYIFRFDYRTRLDIPHGEVFSTFTGTLVDLRSGEVVASADFAQSGFGSESVSDVLNNIVGQLSSVAN